MQDELYEIDKKLIEYEAKRNTQRLYLPVSDLLALDREIERLKTRRLELTDGAGRGANKPGSRSDSMSAEIEAAKRELGDNATPTDVMRKLKSYAEKSGSCIIDVAPDGVIWSHPSGERMKLTLDSLAKRMSRRTRKDR